MRRIPLKLRVVVLFGVIVVVVLAAVGWLVLRRTEDALNGSIDNGLRARADDIAGSIRGTSPPFALQARKLSLEELSFAQLVAPDGTVLASSDRFRGERMLLPDELGRALGGTALLRHAAGSDDAAFRMLATSVPTAAGPIVVVVGADLAERDRTLASLRRVLVTVSPLAAVALAIVGYLALVAALRPLEALRRKAGQIAGTADLSERLPTPASSDEVSGLAATLNEMLHQLEGSRTRERRFLSDASHELRRPLARLKARLEAHLDRPSPPLSAGEARRVLAETADDVERLVHLSESLLLLARVGEENGLELHREPVLLNELARTLVDRQIDAVMDDQRAAIVRGDGGAIALVDRIQIERALMNLLDNARRHGRGTVVVSVVSGAEGHVIAVADAGHIAPEVAAVALQRFTQGDASRHDGDGSGLGLAIVDAIARAHGGRAQIEDTETGTVATLHLPRSDDERSLLP